MNRKIAIGLMISLIVFLAPVTPLKAETNTTSIGPKKLIANQALSL